MNYNNLSDIINHILTLPAVGCWMNQPPELNTFLFPDPSSEAAQR